MKDRNKNRIRKIQNSFFIPIQQKYKKNGLLLLKNIF